MHLRVLVSLSPRVTRMRCTLHLLLLQLVALLPLHSLYRLPRGLLGSSCRGSDESVIDCYRVYPLQASSSDMYAVRHVAYYTSRFVSILLVLFCTTIESILSRLLF